MNPNNNNNNNSNNGGYTNPHHVYHQLIGNSPQKPIVVNTGSSGLIVSSAKGISKGLVKGFNSILRLARPNKREKTNREIAANYINNGQNIMRFPLLVSESIDYQVVAKFCAFLQKERAENVRTFFFNHDIKLDFNKAELAKEFNSNFYESEVYDINGGALLSEGGYEHDQRALGREIGRARAEAKRFEKTFNQREQHFNRKHAQTNRLHDEKMDQSDRHFNDKMDQDREFHKDRIDQSDRHFTNKLDQDYNIHKDRMDQSDRHFNDKMDQDHSFHKDRTKVDVAKLQQAQIFQKQNLAHSTALTHLKHSHQKELMKKEHELRNRLSKKDELSIANQSSLTNNGDLHVKARDLMPILPTMVNIVANDSVEDKQFFQILGVRFIPHLIPFSEMKVAFKYGILNNRFILRFIKWLRNDLSTFDAIFKRDGIALYSQLTKITSNEKAWATNLKNSSQAVSIIISKEEFEDLCENVVNLREPNKFKNVQKDIGLLDLLILDKNAKEVTRINAYDGYAPVKHDMRDVLNANEKDVVINARIDASKLKQEI